jgi:hypothetical protein
LSGLTVAAREFRRRLKSAFFSGISSDMGSPFVGYLFWRSKISNSPKGRNAFKKSSPLRQNMKSNPSRLQGKT